MSRSQVSRLCAEIDERVNAFLTRPPEGAWPCLWLDATYVKVREDGRIVSRAVIIAVAVNEDGKREVLGVATGPSEAETFWTDFLRSLADCGLRGVKPVIADDHKGLRPEGDGNETRRLVWDIYRRPDRRDCGMGPRSCARDRDQSPLLSGGAAASSGSRSACRSVPRMRCRQPVLSWLRAAGRISPVCPATGVHSVKPGDCAVPGNLRDLRLNFRRISAPVVATGAVWHPPCAGNG